MTSDPARHRRRGPRMTLPSVNPLPRRALATVLLLFVTTSCAFAGHYDVTYSGGKWKINTSPEFSYSSGAAG